MTEHLLEVGDGWSIWRQIFLRGAGFPMRQIQRVGSPEVANAARTLLALQDRGTALKAAAEADLRSAKEIAELKKDAKKALRRLLKGLEVNPTAALQARYKSLQEYASWSAELDNVNSAYLVAYEAGEEATARALAEVASDARFQEALLWQNAAAAEVTLPRIRDKSRNITTKQRTHWRLMANYLQRYCTKNDTIGFFGPVGWAEIGDNESAIRFEPGANLLKRRRVYFEFWGIELLADKFSKEEHLWPLIVPRREPSGYLEGDTYCDATGAEHELPDEYCSALRACDAKRTNEEIAELLLNESVTSSIEDGYELLNALAESELIYARFEIPSQTREPERYLRRLLERDPKRSSQALAELDGLEEKRASVASAAGDPEALGRALKQLNAYFEELTQASSSREAGKTYAGRTLVFEDCIRDSKVELGADLIQRISEPLLPVLQSATWFCWEISQRYRKAFRSHFERLCTDAPNAEVTYVQFQEAVRHLFPGPEVGGGIVEDVGNELQAKWAAILSIDTNAARVTRDVDAIAKAAREAFAAPGPGWPSARHHSPDLLISAPSLEALKRHEFTAVLGETHVGHNTVSVPDNAYEHLSPELLAEARKADLDVGIVPTWNNPIRVMLYSILDRDFELESGAGLSHRPREHVLSIGSCVVCLKDDELIVRSRDGGPAFHLIEFLEQHLIAESFSEFQLLGKSAHCPRVTLGDLVIQRESWQVDSADITREKERAVAFVEVQRWASALGLPRFVFVKTPSEIKPFFLDLESIVLVSNFVRLAQAGGSISISEMLPDFDHAWLEDVEGERYCSELRLCYRTDEKWKKWDPRDGES